MQRNRSFAARCVLGFLLSIQAVLAQPLYPLHAAGRQIRDSDDHVVQLRGVNLGGWLVTESWMCGQIDDGKRNALEELEHRFGTDKAASLMNAWQDNWMTTADLDIIRKYGCNVLRVPFSYRTLQDAAGNWKRDATHNIDFARMDWIVHEAQDRQMYVIFDLHVWPGEYHTISRLTPAGDAARAQMSALWTQVAHHYRGVGAIAAFDVINEPEGSPGNTLQKAFYKAIRAEDPRRMLLFESVDYNSIAHENWTNIVWSAHYPEGSAQTGTVEQRLRAFDQQQKLSATPSVHVPIFIGETKAPEDNAASAADLGQALNSRGWGWTVWTYKGVNVGGWASMNYDNALKYDLSKATYDSILNTWTDGLSRWRGSSKPLNLYPNNWWIEGFGRAFKQN